MSMDAVQGARSQAPAVWVIALAVCGGGAMMVLSPIKQRLTDARAGLDGAHAIAAQAGELTASKPLLEMERDRIDSQIGAIEHAGTSVADPSGLVSRINTLAGVHGVVVERVSPKALDTQKSTTGVISPDGVLATTVLATGNFAALTGFISGLERDEILGGVRSIRVTPMMAHGTTDLKATIEMVHASFSVPSNEELAAMAVSMQGAGE